MTFKKMLYLSSDDGYHWITYLYFPILEKNIEIISIIYFHNDNEIVIKRFLNMF